MNEFTRKFFPGDDICLEKGLIRGHGTYVRDNMIISAYFGDLEQIDNLVTVKPKYTFKYFCQVGDVIIGRVVEIQNKKWKLDANCNSETSLSLGSIFLPGIVQRRKQESDEMEMRTFYDRGDLVVAEVQKISKLGNVSLHARSNKFGKLTNGILLQIPLNQMLYTESRFVTFKDFTAIFANNGFIWLSGNCEKIFDFRKIVMNELKTNNPINITEIIKMFS